MPAMTKEQLKDVVNEILKDLVPTSIDERIAEFKAQQAGGYAQLVAGLREIRDERKPEKGIMATQYMMAIAGSVLSAKGGSRQAMSPEAWAAPRFGKDSDVVKALQASSAGSGGFLIPEAFGNELIELFRPASVFMSLNPTVVPLEEGNLTMPKLTGGATAEYIGEGSNLLKSEQTTGQVKMSAKKLGAIVPISNDLLRRTNGAAAALPMVRDDTVASVAQKKDGVFIRAGGTNFTPRGLKNFVPAANTFAATAGQALGTVTSDLAKLVLKLRNGNVRMIRPGFLWSPRTELFLATLRDANGNFAFRDELLRGTFWGWPWKSTTQIPDNLGGGTNESEITFADFADVLVGQTTGVMVDTSTEAAYHDGSQLQSTFSRDETVLRVIEEHDTGMRHDESVAVMTAVTWAP